MEHSINRPLLCPKIIGRTPELAALGLLVEQAKSGQGQMALITREAGIGKSRLVAEIKTEAFAQDFQLLQGNCFPTDLSCPYAPLLDLLRSVFLTSSQAAITADMGPFARELAPLLPEVVHVLPDLATLPPLPSLDPEQEKRRLFGTLAHFFLRQAAQQPVLLIVEDLHWSDDTSLEFLHYLARLCISQPLLLLLTYRSDEVRPNLSHWLAALDREHLAQEVGLSRLTRSETDAMLRAIFDRQRALHAEALNAIYGLTEGNPFFIEEILKSLVAAGEIVFAEGLWERKPLGAWHIPRSIQVAVGQRVDQLSASARQVLILAAVAGRRFDFALLQALTKHDEEQLLTLIKELIAAQLVVEESEEQFAFRHALTRQAIYADLLVRERKALHRTVAETMERLYAPGRPQVSPLHSAPLPPLHDAHLADLAYHFYEAGAWEKALEYGQRAGEKAQALYAPRAAIEYFTNALEAARNTEQPAPTHLYLARGQAYETLGEFERARADYEQALALAHTTQDGPLEWHSVMALGALWAGREYRQAGEWFQRACTLAEALAEPLLQAHSLNRLANWYINTGRTAEGIQTHQEALTIFEARQDQPGMAETLDLLGMAHALHGDHVSAVDYFGRAIDLFRSQGNTPSLASALASRAIIAGPADVETLFSALGTPDECLRDATEALQLARKIESLSAQAYAGVMTAWWLTGFGDFGAAQAHAQEALSIATEMGHQQWMAATYCVLGRLLTLMLDPTQAIQLLEAGLSLSRDLGSAFWIGMITSNLALAYLLRRESAKAQAVLEAAMPTDAHPRNLAERRMLWAWGELAFAEGDYQGALRIAGQLLASAPGTSRAQPIPWLLKLKGEALVALLHLDEAAQTLEAAKDGARQRQERPLLWQVHCSLGQVYQRLKDEERAERAFAAARSVIAELAASITEPTLRELFSQEALKSLPREKPIPERRAATERFGGLTEREREVLRLLAMGLTSAQIAERLTISLLTVNTHARSIYSKLGVTSRSAATRYAIEHHLV